MKEKEILLTDLFFFRLPQSEMANEWEVGGDFMKYDSAHRTKQACWELFPSCFKDVDFY
jgi:hypothetical protein